MSKETIEKQTASTLLQKPVEVNIGGRKVRAPQPTLETLVSVSERISELPTDMTAGEDGNVFVLTLRHAKEYKTVADIIATMLIPTRIKRYSLLSWVYTLRYRRMVRRLRYTVSPSQMQEICTKVLQTMQIGDFFGLTTFLAGINLTKATKVENSTTASGQQ